VGWVRIRLNGIEYEDGKDNLRSVSFVVSLGKGLRSASYLKHKGGSAQ
jgi:hypothetical protein